MAPRFALKGRDHLATPDRKRRFNRLHFEAAATRYDVATRAMSLGRDGSWKRALISALPDLAAPACIDLACGTGDVALLLAARYPRGVVAGVDLVPRMLEMASRRPGCRNVAFQAGDLCALPFADGCADIVTGAYALRNAPELRAALAEIRRILKPGGCAAVLDFCRPRRTVSRRARYVLLRGWCGLWGILLHGTPEIHGYVAESLERFPDRLLLREILAEEGFAVASSRRFFAGVTELLVLRRKGESSHAVAREYNGTSDASGARQPNASANGEEVSRWNWR